METGYVSDILDFSTRFQSEKACLPSPMVTFRSLLKIVTGSSKPLGFKALK
jgi:hypothetical protein